MIIYWQLFSVFFKIGLFSFGGGLAMIAFIQQEIIRPNTRKARIKRSEKLATLNPCRSFLSKLE